MPAPKFLAMYSATPDLSSHVSSQAERAIVPNVLDGINERSENGMIILSPVSGPSLRRVLYINSYGGSSSWRKVKQGALPPQHFWGCLELVRRGYEVALTEPLPFFYFRKNPLPHDLKFLSTVRDWLGQDGIVYCGHTLLYWLPLLSWLRCLRCHVVSLCYAREELDFVKLHSGVIAMTAAAADEIKKRAPSVKVAHLGWGCDLSFYPRLRYQPEWFLSCGITNRDFGTLVNATSKSEQRFRLITPGPLLGFDWPDNVAVINGGQGWCVDDKQVSFDELLHRYYAQCAASLIILKPDPTQYTANGFTNLLEAMAMAQPVIMTRTGAVPSEIDLEKVGCGLFVPASDPNALREAVKALADDPGRAQMMGQKGRHLVETHYNMDRYGRDLHTFFESL
jgi:glycosyltransferase involved in cell wall biosynthesis